MPVIRRVPGEDQIEVGSGGEVALTQPAHGKHQNIPLDCAVAAFHIGARKITDDADHRFRPVGQCASDRDAVGDTAQPLHLCPEPALARFSCDAFQSAFDRHVTDAVSEFCLETVGIRQRREEITEQHQIEQHRMVSERCSESWRQHQDIAEEARQVAVMVEQRENLHACWQPLDKAGEGGEGGVRISRRGEMRDHWWDDPSQKCARPLAACRGNPPGGPA